MWWLWLAPAVIPSPLEVVQALVDLVGEGLASDLYTSLVLYFQAVCLATLFSALLSYSAALAFFRPAAHLWSKLRFLGIVGLPFFLTMFLNGAHALKLALLVFSISVFLVSSMLDVIAAIPKEKYDLARTLRMGEWQVLWEVQVLGRADVMFDMVRECAAMGWMMLCVVEGLYRSEGGVGALLMTQDKHFHLASIVAIQLLFLGIGLAQDWLIGVFKDLACPYSKLILQRR